MELEGGRYVGGFREVNGFFWGGERRGEERGGIGTGIGRFVGYHVIFFNHLSSLGLLFLMDGVARFGPRGISYVPFHLLYFFSSLLLSNLLPRYKYINIWSRLLVISLSLSSSLLKHNQSQT